MSQMGDYFKHQAEKARGLTPEQRREAIERSRAEAKRLQDAGVRVSVSAQVSPATLHATGPVRDEDGSN